MTQKYVVIGNSAAGIAAARTLRSLDPSAHIICVSDEPGPSYNKCFLVDFIAGHKTETQTHTSSFIQTLDIDMRYDTCVIGIESDNNLVMFKNGKQESYDALLLATGTRPIWPPIAGIHTYTNIFPFHGLVHAQQIDSFIKQQQAKTAVIIGGGLSGIELADALHKRGMQVHIVERSDRVLKHHLTVNGSLIVQDAMRRAGVMLHLSQTIGAIEGKDQHAKAVVLAHGDVLQTDLIIHAIGVKQNLALAEAAQLTCDAYGIVVNEYMQTSVPRIYAAGDIIGITDLISGRRTANCTWQDAMQQGRHAAHGMVESPLRYSGAHLIATSSFFGFSFASCGVPHKDMHLVEHMDTASYVCYLGDKGYLKGFQLLGDGKQFPYLRKMVLSGQPVELRDL